MPIPGFIVRHAALWAVLWAVLILVLTLMPVSDVPRWTWADVIHLDKFVHAFLFGVQGLLLGLALANLRPQEPPPVLFAWAMLAAGVYGAVIEVVQQWMGQGRHGDVLDLLADAAGAVAGYAWLRWRHRRGST
ncbi:MAG: VanZ family protein [Flavobacteriales bacterium]|nr:VanZ family protein [Flavobacteriales bacterium]MBP9079025.1 VanZ family protein [Flavobacteriales bacterium]